MSTTETALIRVVEGQIVAADELRLTLDDLKTRAQGIVVHDNPSCERALEVVKSGKEAIKQITAIAEPERLRLDTALKELRFQRDKLIQPFSEVITPLEKQARDYRIAEQEAARAEQAKLNKGKAAEDRVEVKPDVPNVPGVRFQTRYKAEVVNEEELVEAFLRARGDRRDYLRKFICANADALNREAREVKDMEKLTKAIPGVRFWRE